MGQKRNFGNMHPPMLGAQRTSAVQCCSGSRKWEVGSTDGWACSRVTGGWDSLQVWPGRATHMQEGGGFHGFPPPHGFPSIFLEVISNSQKTCTHNTTLTKPFGDKLSTQCPVTITASLVTHFPPCNKALLHHDAEQPPTAGSRPDVLRPLRVSPVFPGMSMGGAKGPSSELPFAGGCHMHLVSFNWSNSSVFPRFPHVAGVSEVTSPWFWRTSLKLGLVAPPGGTHASLSGAPHCIPAGGSGFAPSCDR